MLEKEKAALWQRTGWRIFRPPVFQTVINGVHYSTESAEFIYTHSFCMNWGGGIALVYLYRLQNGDWFCATKSGIWEYKIVDDQHIIGLWEDHKLDDGQFVKLVYKYFPHTQKVT